MSRNFNEATINEPNNNLNLEKELPKRDCVRAMSAIELTLERKLTGHSTVRSEWGALFIPKTE